MDTNKWLIYIISGLFVLSSLFCLLSLAYTSIENVSARNLEEKIARRKNQLEEASKEEASLSEWRNIKGYFDQFKKDYLMEMDDLSQFRDNLKMIFNKYGLTNKQIQHKYKRPLRDYILVEVTFTISGLYPNIKRFIHEILGKKKMILIKRIQFIKSKGKPDIAGKFIMEVYLAR
ncbi:MAG: hypothetical protein JSV88_08590 [Candidatus Aminicenantes bacterium]|nr:MAG: hypothetical protein JSV88_08590 [Candidatus Aminicenantes bacterium]